MPLDSDAATASTDGATASIDPTPCMSSDMATAAIYGSSGGPPSPYGSSGGGQSLPGQGSGIPALLGFDVSQAHTYDPNEEARLRKVIDTVGRKCFEARIQDLTAACVESQRQTMTETQHSRMDAVETAIAAWKALDSRKDSAQDDVWGLH